MSLKKHFFQFFQLKCIEYCPKMKNINIFLCITFIKKNVHLINIYYTEMMPYFRVVMCNLIKHRVEGRDIDLKHQF